MPMRIYVNMRCQTLGPQAVKAVAEGEAQAAKKAKLTPAPAQLAAFEFTPAEDHAVPAVDPDSADYQAAKTDFSKPFMIVGKKWLADHKGADAQFKAEVDAFLAVFTSSGGNSSGRGQIRMTNACLADDVYRKFLEHLKLTNDDLIPAPASSSLQQVFAPATFGIAQNITFSGFDLSAIPCLRYTLAGTRSVMVARFSSIGEYVRGLSSEAAQSRPISLASVQHWIQTATVEQLDEFIKAGSWGQPLGLGRVTVSTKAQTSSPTHVKNVTHCTAHKVCSISPPFRRRVLVDHRR